jgi:hypothetical protein
MPNRAERGRGHPPFTAASFPRSPSNHGSKPGGRQSALKDACWGGNGGCGRLFDTTRQNSTLCGLFESSASAPKAGGRQCSVSLFRWFTRGVTMGIPGRGTWKRAHCGRRPGNRIPVTVLEDPPTVGRGSVLGIATPCPYDGGLAPRFASNGVREAG